jgi:hypothetical protein
LSTWTGETENELNGSQGVKNLSYPTRKMKAKRLLMSLNERGFLEEPSSRGNRKNEVWDFDQKILVHPSLSCKSMSHLAGNPIRRGVNPI